MARRRGAVPDALVLRLCSAPLSSGASTRANVAHPLSTSSLRAQRSNPESFRGGRLDCFAALAMTMRMECTPHLHPAPVSLKRSPMHLDRRSLLASLCWMAASPVLAADALPESEPYERKTGGRI